MMGDVKKFLRWVFDRPNFPAIMKFYDGLDLKELRARQERHSQMTYAEIENEIGQRYEKTYGRKLDWENPQTYNEKINVSKIYMVTPLKTKLSDKLRAREWITEKIGSDYLIPLLGVYDSFDEINFDALPEKFIIKCNHDSGSVTLVKDKSKLDKIFLRRKYNLLMARNFGWQGWELQYKDITPKIIIEKYMGDAINDYKFMCFSGGPACVQVDFERFANHTRNYYDLDWNVQYFTSKKTPMNYDTHPRPKEFSRMIEIAKELSRDFDQVRVDLYLVDGKIYCGEMTFSDGNGFCQHIAGEVGLKFGALWKFDNTARKKVLAERARP